MAPKHDGFRDFVLDQLDDLPGLTYRAMFGGYGLYQRDTFFGIIHKGRLYFKTDRITAPRYRDRGVKPFTPTSTQTLKNYYEVPIDVLEAPDDLIRWASEAAER
ncbi:MAG: TfoX/Sxy family protein [Nitrospiraceae bacterium]|jgi:DNA transformation protein|nr:TfoX/Sxy family protein [Nitrospiraceae bacterium]